MSLGRLLRRASSKASDLLTLTPGGSSTSPSMLDGEIIYSKNNVCVHPPELLQGIGEHHPGYLCLYMEKDELLGTTLILAWVPNSRIQRQDEEALRYITPESSPVRKAPRKRGRHAQGFGPPPRSDSGILSTVSSQEEQNRSELSAEGTEECLDCRPEPGEDEGSLELSADDVSRDSTFDSDSDAFSSPFCLSPISEALGKSSSSVFLDNES
ncbi:PREDICTED: TBC1 domain family member 16-like, partial [Acanthisitta chloris]|uniref:TBC1 domain family member 16-like n=1 Tax=Acanthisitta chloris TaxID=57068 RepID=UPI0004F0C909